MISPREIRERARKVWLTGRPLASTLPGAGSLFPYVVAFRKPSAREWLDRFAELRAAAVLLERECKAVRGAGFSLELREMTHQRLGQQRVPERILFETVEDLAAVAGESAALDRFRTLTRMLESREPQLVAWVARRSLALLALEPDLAPLLATAARFREHPRPGCFARELGVPGVDGKFIETHKALLAEWLDLLLPPEAIDASVRGLSDRGFERRYGLRYEEPPIRFRWLDSRRALADRITDATVPLSQFMAFAPACEHVIVTENKINFLALPDRRNALAIFGGGYAIELLGDVKWLGRQPLHYWGDVDTHGFSILSRLRALWPDARSFLMDHQTLLVHRALWTQEPSQGRSLRDLPALGDHEQSLYDDLRFDRLGERVRLEQEKIGFTLVEAAVLNL
jgi:hypothetical protein